MKQSTKKGRGGVRPGSGRKPFEDPRSVRSKRVIFNVTESELEEIRAAADGSSLSTFIREVVMKALRRRKK